jgi:hypothetical protein
MTGIKMDNFGATYSQQTGAANRPYYTPGEQALKLVRAADKIASRLGTIGFSARGVRLALEQIGIFCWAPNAVALAKSLQASGHFLRLNIPINQAQPGDIIVRLWSSKVQREKSTNAGDIIIVTGRNSTGTLRGASDNHWSSIASDGTRYRNSYVLRFR